jgi:hypothetical protein
VNRNDEAKKAMARIYRPEHLEKQANLLLEEIAGMKA